VRFIDGKRRIEGGDFATFGIFFVIKGMAGLTIYMTDGFFVARGG
jgi:hypothetical protein